MNTAVKSIEFPVKNNEIVITPEQLNTIVMGAIQNSKKKRSHKHLASSSVYKTNGFKKATAAEPIRTKEDFRKIVDYLGSHGSHAIRNKTLFIVGCTTGLRCSDVLKLTTADVFNQDGSVKSHIDIIEEKTYKRNICKITNMTKLALIELYNFDNPTISNDTFLFRGKYEDPLTGKAVYKIINNAGNACGLPGLSTHTMRKTYAMIALLSAEQYGNAGQTLEMLQMKLNHSDARITMRYCKVAQDKMDQMSDSVGEWLGE